MRRSISWGLFVVIMSLVCGPMVVAQSEQDVSGAINNDHRCDDGIGESGVEWAFWEALRSDAGEEYVTRTSACIGPVGSEVTFTALCTPALRVTGVTEPVVVCRVEINNHSDKTILYDNDSFAIITDSAIFPIFTDMDDVFMLGLPLGDAPGEISPDGSIVVLVPFAITADAIDQPRALLWHAPSSLLEEGAPEPMILIEDEDPEVLRILGDQLDFSLLAPGAIDGEIPADFQVTGMGDTLIGPIEFNSGAFVVTAAHEGDSAFTVTAVYEDGTSDQLVSSKGFYNGEVALRLPSASRALLEVKSDGPWEIEIKPAF